MRRIAFVLMLVALGVGAPAAAAATPVATPVSDGVRLAAWLLPWGATRVLDGRTGETLDVAGPDGCGAPTAAGGGRVVWSCPAAGTGQPYPVLMDVATARTFLPVGLQGFLEPASASGVECGPWTAVGTRWLKVGCGAYHAGEDDFYEIATGRVVRITTDDGLGAPPPPDRTHVVSLDAPDATQRLCAPVKLARNPKESGLSGTYPAQDVVTADGWVAGTAAINTDQLLVQRCGTRKPIVVDEHCFEGCGDIQIGGGWLSWVATKQVHVVRLGRKRVGTPMVRFIGDDGAQRAGSIVVIGNAKRLWRLPGAPELALP